MGLNDLDRRGWARFAFDPGIAAWAAAARPRAEAAMADPGMRTRWLVCEGTWFVGVDALDNADDGGVAGVPLAGPVMDEIARRGWPVAPLHPAQVSEVWPGYPRPRAGEGDAAFGYRVRRDAAHVDGVRKDGPDGARVVSEPHAYILGLPLSDSHPDAAPLVVWDGAHRVMAEAFATAFEGQNDPGAVDVTQVYTEARRKAFDTCPRVELPARPGEALLLHRLMLHGVAPWSAPDGPPRIVAYFRPPMVDVRGWASL